MAEDLAGLQTALSQWCARLDANLRGLEPYRALLQLGEREASGRPVEAMATGKLRAHLEQELAASRDYRVLALLRQAMTELRGPEAVAAAEPAAAPPDPATIPPPPAGRNWNTDDLQSEASQAVASMFGLGAGASIQSPASVPDRVASPGQSLPAARDIPPPAAAAVAPPPAPVQKPDFQPVRAVRIPPPPIVELVPPVMANAEATVFASLVKLRKAPDDPPPAGTPPDPIAKTTPFAPAHSSARNAAPPIASSIPANNGVTTALEAAPRRVPATTLLRSMPSKLATPPADVGRRPLERSTEARDAAEIRFVERPAITRTDNPPADKPSVPANEAPFRTHFRPSQTAGGQTAAEWEEASVEIRRSPSDQIKAAAPPPVELPAATPVRAGAVFSRLVKPWTRDKT